MKISWLLIFVPLAIGAQLLNLSPTIVFVLAFLAMIPLAALIGQAVDVLALYTGPSVGALLTATFGTLTEIFILLNLLRTNQLDVIKYEITGSVLLGLIFVIGLSELVGGIKHGFQKYDGASVSIATSVMALAVIGMLIPTFFAVTEQVKAGIAVGPDFQDPALDALSIGVALALLALYILYLFFLYRYLPARTSLVRPQEPAAEKPRWTKARTIGLLSLATLGVAVVSSILTDALEPFGNSVGLSTLFLGLIVLPVAGGFADIVVAIRAAANNRIGLSFSLSTGAVMQTALLVAPLMVLLSPLLGNPLTLSFGFVQVVAMALSVAIISLIANDGIANWFEGAQFITLYGILALWFFLIT